PRTRMKEALAGSPFFTSRVISARASSTSARTSVDTWAVASLTRSPIDGSGLGACGSTSGIEVTVVGTPFFLSTLLTDVPPQLDVAAAAAPGVEMSLANHVATSCRGRRSRRNVRLTFTVEWAVGTSMGDGFLRTGYRWLLQV